jgi:hypothetical protein
MKPRLSTPVTLRELAALLGWPLRASQLRRLRRLLVARERHLRRQGHDVTIYHCAGERLPGYATLAQLRAYMPELFDTQAEMVAGVRAAVEELREGTDEALARTALLGRRLAAVESRLRALETRSR